MDTFEPELKVSSWLRSGPLSLISSSVRLSRELDKNGFGFWNNDTVDTTVVDRYATVRSSQAGRNSDKRNFLFFVNICFLCVYSCQISMTVRKCYSTYLAINICYESTLVVGNLNHLIFEWLAARSLYRHCDRQTSKSFMVPKSWPSVSLCVCVTMRAFVNLFWGGDELDVCRKYFQSRLWRL